MAELCLEEDGRVCLRRVDGQASRQDQAAADVQAQPVVLKIKIEKRFLKGKIFLGILPYRQVTVAGFEPTNTQSRDELNNQNTVT